MNSPWGGRFGLNSPWSGRLDVNIPWSGRHDFQHIAGMSESNSPSSDNPNDAQRPSASANAAQPNSCQVSEIEPAAAPRGRRPSRAASHTPRRQGSPAPPPSRRPPPSPASSYASVLRSVTAIQKWTVASLRQALSNADVYYSQRMTKTELYNIFCSIQSTPPPKAAGNQATPHGTPYARPEQTSSPTRKGLRSSSRRSRPSASLGRSRKPQFARPPCSTPARPPCSTPARRASLRSASGRLGPLTASFLSSSFPRGMARGPTAEL
ncbi:hypothetical protein Q8A67_009325 [Cirrhinus molitorella]|uniref:Uncharacterized protein n=1 Tax=Cirrhinus molitorella TaxID=172907 RepID=A0AA88Q6F3_9TELE|nr:hypothetical protein Q8A67_009325 [Cirrhinus molitorella]